LTLMNPKFAIFTIDLLYLRSKLSRLVKDIHEFYKQSILTMIESYKHYGLPLNAVLPFA